MFHGNGHFREGNGHFSHGNGRFREGGGGVFHGGGLRFHGGGSRSHGGGRFRTEMAVSLRTVDIPVRAAGVSFAAEGVALWETGENLLAGEISLG